MKQRFQKKRERDPKEKIDKEISSIFIQSISALLKYTAKKIKTSHRPEENVCKSHIYRGPVYIKLEYIKLSKKTNNPKPPRKRKRKETTQFKKQNKASAQILHQRYEEDKQMKRHFTSLFKCKLKSQ